MVAVGVGCELRDTATKATVNSRQIIIYGLEKRHMMLSLPGRIIRTSYWSSSAGLFLCKQTMSHATGGHDLCEPPVMALYRAIDIRQDRDSEYSATVVWSR